MPGARAGVTPGSKAKATVAEVISVPVVYMVENVGAGVTEGLIHAGRVAGSKAKVVGLKFASGDARRMAKLWLLFVKLLPTAPNGRNGPRVNGEFNNERVTGIARLA